MKKITFFLILLAILGGTAWGDTFTWVGGAWSGTPSVQNWSNLNNWRINGQAVSRYPSGVGDIAIISGNGDGISVDVASIQLDELRVNTPTAMLFNGNDMTVGRLVLSADRFGFTNGHLNVTTTELNSNIWANEIPTANAELSTVNLTIGSLNGLQIAPGNNITMNGAPIAISSANMVTITKTNPNEDLNIGSIIAGARVITLNSGRDVTLMGDISAQRLIINAANGNVTVNSSVNIDTANVANSPLGSCSHTGNVSIYVDAVQFRAYGGAGRIFPATAGQMCLNLSGGYLISTGKIDGNRYHACNGTELVVPLINNHLVYGTGPVPGDIPSPNQLVNSNDALGNSLTYQVADGYNIYIVNVGNTAPSNTRSADFIVDGSGFIEIRGNYTSSGNLNLSPGAGGIHLNNANINLSGSSFDTSDEITLRGTGSSITALGITLGEVTGALSGNSNLTLEASGVINLNSIGPYINNLSIESLLTNIRGNITTAGNQTYKGAIELGSAGTRALTSSGGSISTDLAITGSVPLTINAHNNIVTGNGGINLGNANTLTFISTTGNININGNITNTNRLIIQALSASSTVTVAGNVSINLTSNGVHDPSNNEGLNAASIYVKANTFTAAAGAGIITPGTAGRICLAVDNFTNNGNGRIDGGRYHHPCIEAGAPATPANSHWVYSEHPVPGLTGSSYFYINPTADERGLLQPDSGYNVYIIDVSSQGQNLTINTTGSNNYIEFRGDYTSAYTLTLNPGSGGVRLNNAKITLSGTGNNFNTGSNAVTLIGTGNSNSITAYNITLGDVTGNGNNLALSPEVLAIINSSAGIGALNITGNAQFGGTTFPPTLPVSAHTVTVSGECVLRANVTTSGTGNSQSYGSVNLYSTSNAGIRVLTGTSITIGTVTSALITGTGLMLEIAGNAVLNGNVNNIRRLTVSGTTYIGGNITTNGATAANGGMVLTGNVTLGVNVTLTSHSLAAISLGNITGGGHNLTINNGAGAGTAAVTFSGASGIGTLMVNRASQINADITTTGSQTYTGNVTLGGGAAGDVRTLTGGGTGSAVLFSGTVAGQRILTITDADVTFNGAVGAAVGTRLNGIIVNATAGNTPGAATVNANISTTGDQYYHGHVELGGNITFTGGAAGTIRFGNVVNSTNTTARTLTVATAAARFDGDVGADSTRPISIVTTAAVHINAGITTTGAQSYAAAAFGDAANTQPIILTGTTITALGTVSRDSGYDTANAVIVNASETITMDYADNDLNGAVELHITQNAPTPARSIVFRTTGDITLTAVNDTANGTIAINQSGALSIASLEAPNNGSITLGESAANRAGEINQTGTIVTQNLTLWSSAGIMLNDDNNEVSSLTIQSAGGNVNFSNTAASLSISGITGTGNNSVSVTNSADIAIADVINTTGLLTLESIAGDININASINAERLLLLADENTGGVTVAVNAGIEVTSEGNHDTSPGDGLGAAIYVKANSFIAIEDTDPNQNNWNLIYPGTIGRICLDVNNFEPKRRIYHNHFCYHKGVPQGMHLVYGTVNIFENAVNWQDYYWVSSTIALEEFTVTGDRNIYIVDVIPAKTHDLKFITDQGFIEFQGEFNSTAALVLTSNYIRLNGADIHIGDDFNEDIILVEDKPNSITAQNITLGTITRNALDNDTSNLSLTAAVNGDVTLNDIEDDKINNLTVTVSGTGTININKNVITEGSQSYIGSVELKGLNAFEFTGTSVSFGTIAGNDETLTINGTGAGGANAVFNGGDNIGALLINGNASFFGTTALEAESIVVEGEAVIGASLTTTYTTGTAQHYKGNVTISGVAALGGVTGTTVHFEGTVDGVNGETSNLIITHMNVLLSGEAGGNEPLTSITLGTQSDSVGTITASEAVKTENLSVNSVSAVTFNNSANAIDVFLVTGSGGDVVIVNSKALEIAGISGAASSAITITTTGSGSHITQSGLITGGVALILTSGGGIDLAIDEEDGINIYFNEVNSISILGAAGDVSFTNKTTITLSNIAVLEDYVMVFNSIEGDIDIVSPGTGIECYRLELIAVNGNIGIDNTIRVYHDHDCHHEPGPNDKAAIYILATSISGNGDIYLMDDPDEAKGEVCVFIKHPIAYNGKVRDKNGNDTGNDRIHYHIMADRNIIYRYGLSTDPLPSSDIEPYDPDQDIYVQADSFTGHILNAVAGKNIYIIDIYDNSGLANSRYVNFQTGTQGEVHIFGEYYSSSLLNIEYNYGGSIHLRDVNRDNGPVLIDSKITIVSPAGNSEFNSNGRRIILQGTAPGTYTIEANTITLAEVSSYNNEDRSLTLNGNAVLNDTVSGLTNFYVSGTSLIKDNITTTENQTYMGDAVIDGNAITLDAVNITFNGKLDVINADLTTINNSGVYTQIGDVSSSGSFIQTSSAGTGTVSLSGNVTASNAEKNNAIISFESEVNLAADNITFAVPQTGGMVVFASGVIDNGNTLIISGGSSDDPLVISQTSGAIGSITIKQNSYVLINGSDTIRQNNDRTLTLQGESAAGAGDGSVLNIGAGSWHMGTGASSSNDFNGIHGALNLGTASLLMVNNFNVSGNEPFNLANTGKAVINVNGNVNISGTNTLNGGDLPLLLIEMTGTAQNLSANNAIGSLHITSGSVTNLGSDLGVQGELQIDYNTTSGILNAGSNNIIMYAGLSESKGRVSRWRIIGAQETVTSGIPTVMNAFLQDENNSVEFRKLLSSDTNIYIEIIGNTVWQNFVCEADGAIIQFTTHPHQHVFLKTFEVMGIVSNRIRLTRLPYDNTSGITTGNENWTHYYNYSQHGLPNGVNAENAGIPGVPDDPNLKTNPTEILKFWNFNLYQLSGLLIDYVEVYFSHAWTEPMIVETDVLVVPYFEGSNGHFNHNWREDNSYKIIYSFIEDANGDGRADRIRVQTSITVYGTFDGFVAEVEGYTVRGYEFTQNVTNNQSDNDSFYILLDEKSYLYDGLPLSWRITNNRQPDGRFAIRDGRNRPIISQGDVGEIVFATFNTIPPRISYAISLPDRGETYIQMSQPVAPWNNSAAVINGSSAMTGAIDTAQRPRDVLVEHTDPDNPGTLTLKPDQPSLTGALSFLINNNANTINELASLPPIGTVPPANVSFTMQGFWNLAERALDWNVVDENFPPPKYPVDWNYSGYLAYPGNDHVTGSPNDPVPVTNMFVPPFQVLTPQMMRDLEAGNTVTPSSFQSGGDLITRRNTDVLVSVPPAASNSTNYFAWPVWARFVNPLNPDVFNDNEGEFWGQLNTDTGVIWEFDGTHYLEARGDIELQSRINPDLTGTLGLGALELFWTANIDTDFRNPMQRGERGRGTGGLWIPNLNGISPLYYYAPPGAVQKTLADTFISPLYNYLLNGTSGEKIEFVFRFENSDMISARLDISRGAAIPNNWYRLVRPFGFDIQDITRQRGGVTILNNVINSDNREVTYVRYNLVRPGRVTIQVHTLDGTLVRSIRRNEHREAGEWTDSWNGTNNGGRPVARGMYFIRVVGPDIDEIRKVMVVR